MERQSTFEMGWVGEESPPKEHDRENRGGNPYRVLRQEGDRYTAKKLLSDCKVIIIFHVLIS